MAIRIVIVDDHDIIRAGIKAYLSRMLNMKFVRRRKMWISFGMRGKFKPDILLLDISMPKISGLI